MIISTMGTNNANIIAKESRRMCSTSFKKTAVNPLKALSTLRLQLLTPVRQFHEDVFKVGHQWADLVRPYAHADQVLCELFLRDALVHQGVDGAAKDRGGPQIGKRARFAQRSCHF